MISFIIKHWRLLVDMAIVVGVVIAFTFWDPFKIFNKRKLLDTANLVTEVRDIGQLVTAEYFGEVISSLNGVKLKTYPEDTLTQHVNELYLQIRMDLTEPKLKDADSYRPVLRTKDPYKSMYQELMAFLGEKYTIKKLNNIYDEQRQQVYSDIEWKVYRRMARELNNDIDRIRKKHKNDENLEDIVRNYRDSVPPFMNKFYEFFSSLRKKTGETLKANRNIVFIGRGSVKAGFDFQVLDERNFEYNANAKVVHFFGFKPKILDADINPWFIPETKLKGFELVASSNKLTFEDAKAVKADCKDQLLLQAGKANILAQAKVNGEEALRTFFSLLLDEPDLKVVIHELPYDHQLTTIEADSVVSIREAIIVDSLYTLELKKQKDRKIDPQTREEYAINFSHFIHRLKKLPFIRKGHPFNYFTMKAAAMLRDSLHVRSGDIQQVDSLRSRVTFRAVDKNIAETPVVTKNKLWFENADFMIEFNSLLEVIFSESDFVDTTRYRLNDFAYDYRMIEFLSAQRIDTVFLRDTVMTQPKPVIYNKRMDSLRTEELDDLDEFVRAQQKSDAKTAPLRKLRKKLVDLVGVE